VPPQGYLWHSECAPGTCSKPRAEVECPAPLICQHCGILEHNDPICPKASILDLVLYMNSYYDIMNLLFMIECIFGLQYQLSGLRYTLLSVCRVSVVSDVMQCG